MTEPILLSVDNGLARITLNRPERLNAFNAAMSQAWGRVIEEVLDRDDVGAVLLNGSGPAFCAGGDVAEMATSSPDGAQLEALAQHINRGIVALTTSTVPVVLAAHGATAGGGLGIFLCSDYAVVGRSARVGSRYAAMGLTPDLSVTAQLALAVGQRRALQLVLSDRMLSAEEALSWGLAAEVVDDDEVLTRAEQVARSWLEGATGAFGKAKWLVRRAPEQPFADQLDAEARTIGESFATPEAQARIRAFLRR